MLAVASFRINSFTTDLTIVHTRTAIDMALQLYSAVGVTVPPAARLKVHGPVNREAEALLAHCNCGGTTV